MEPDKSILLQKQVRDNSEDLQSEFLDLKNWEQQMKKVDAEIRNDGEERILPPVRRKEKTRKESSRPRSCKENAANSKRIKSCDYSAWEKFDVNKACSELDKNETDDEGEEPLSKEELERNHEEATKDKIAGNNHVKKGEWAKAAACYSAAFKKFPYDAVFLANRALCHLKMDNLHMAEADCTAAIEMDEFYVKAYHRRASARISLKRYEAAAQDIKKMLKLEPANKEAQAMLVRVTKLLENSKPVVLSSTRTKFAGADTEKGKMLEAVNSEIKSGEKIQEKRKTEIELFPKLPEWLPEVAEDVGIVEVITKPPHQRSKKPLRTVTIEEIEFGPKSQKIGTEKTEKPENSVKDEKKKEKTGCQSSEPENPEIFVPEAPKTAVEFLSTWGKNKSTQFRYKYLKKIEPERIPTIFRDSMESKTFSEILQVLRLEFVKRGDPVLSYLNHLSHVKRFRTLTMFMNKNDREDVRALLDYSKTLEHPSEDLVKELFDKYEI